MMIILRKKRIFLIFCFLILSFSTCFLANSKTNENRTYDITQVSTIPVTEKVIVIDAGHGRRRPEVLLIQVAYQKLKLI